MMRIYTINGAIIAITVVYDFDRSYFFIQLCILLHISKVICAEHVEIQNCDDTNTYLGRKQDR